MTDFILVEEFKQYLVAQTIVRADNNTPGALPPCWLNPQEGPKQPTGQDTAAVTLRPAGQIPTRHLEGFLENSVVEVIVRATHAAAGERLQRQIRRSVNDRHHFALGDLTVQWCLLSRGVQPMPLPVGAASKTWDTTQTFTFQIRVADLVTP